MDEVTATWTVHKMSDFLSRYYGRRAIILLDEYDTPMQEAYVDGYWEELTAFTRSLFNAAFKTNPYLERAIMMGVTRVSRESIFSDLNNLEVVTTTSDKYADSFGFTEEEVFTALEKFGLWERKNEVKEWHDGFTFGNHTDIYNPWSILNYLDKKRLGVYWANSSSNSLVGKLIREGNREIKQEFENLLKGGTLRVEIDEQIVYGELSSKRNSIWSLLLASGYLKTLDVEFTEETGIWNYSLVLTNKEVGIMFANMIRGWFSDSDGNYNEFIKALLKNDLKAMNAYMNRVALATFSYFDTGKRPSGTEPERFYHGFVLGLMVELSGRYVLTSNRESGFGRYDVMLEPKNEQDDAMILEFKVQDEEEERELSDTVQAALRQIKEQNYDIACGKGHCRGENSKVWLCVLREKGADWKGIKRDKSYKVKWGLPVEQEKRMDRMDRKILRHLKENSRQTASRISQNIHLSVSAVIERIRKLERTGIIQKYTVVLDEKKLGNTLTVFVLLKLSHSKYHESFAKEILAYEGICECHVISGNMDYLLKIVTNNASSLELVHQDLRKMPGVSSLKTLYVLSTIKNEYSVLPDDEE